MTSIAARFLPSSYMTPSSKPAESTTSQQNSQATKAPQDPIGELKKYAASLTNQHRAGLFSAMAKTDGSQATSSPSLSTSNAMQLPDVANLDRDEAAHLLTQVDKMLDKDLDARLTFSGSNGKEQTDSLSTYRDWLQAKGGINTYA